MNRQRNKKPTRKEQIIRSIQEYIRNKETAYWITKKYWWNGEKITYILRNIRRHNNEITRLEIELIETIERGC